MSASLTIFVFFTLEVLGTQAYKKEDIDVGSSLLQGYGAPSPVNLECLAQHCTLQLGGCVLNAKCRDVISCAQKCFNEWDADKTPEKYHVQNCTNICAFSYRGKAYIDLMTCAEDNNCANFPPIPSQCKAPGNISIQKKISTKDLLGSWWVVAGRHPVYDCYPCQHLHFNKINGSNTTLEYLPFYQVYLANGSLSVASDPYIIPITSPGENVSFVYHDTGLTHTETWWLIDEAEDQSYVLIYYCGNTLQWYYDGALVFSKETSLPASALTDVAKTYAKATGLDFSTFCKTSTSPCPNY